MLSLTGPKISIGASRRYRPRPIVCLQIDMEIIDWMLRLYDTSSHAFEVQIDTSSHGGAVRWRWICIAARGVERACVRRTKTSVFYATYITLTFICLFIWLL